MTLNRHGESLPAVCLRDRKSTRLNSSHQIISYAVFCLINKNSEKIYEINKYLICIESNVDDVFFDAYNYLVVNHNFNIPALNENVLKLLLCKFINSYII